MVYSINGSLSDAAISQIKYPSCRWHVFGHVFLVKFEALGGVKIW